MWELRTAASNDREFLWKVHRTAFRPVVEATWGWDERFQERYFAEHFTTSDRFIVRVDGVDAGVLQFTVEPDHVFLTTVALLPEHQGRGLGTQLVNRVVEEGRRRHLPARLQVLKVNRARKLYERLGFEPCGENETHVHMERRVQGKRWDMADRPDQRLLDALLDSWDRGNTILVNLLRALPAGGLEVRVVAGSPTVAELFTHIHYVRLVFVREDAPEFARDMPREEWALERDPVRIAQMLHESAQAVRDAVKGRVEASRDMDLHYDHPILMLQHMLWHEGYHHGQVKLALKMAGRPLTDEDAGPVTWGVWMRKS